MRVKKHTNPLALAEQKSQLPVYMSLDMMLFNGCIIPVIFLNISGLEVIRADGKNSWQMEAIALCKHTLA